MRVGVTIFSTDLVGDVVAIAREAEARGFHSLFLPEHTHIPTNRVTPPPTGDDTLAEEYSRTLDPVVALSACATATTTLRLGTGVALPAQHHPIDYAKAWATLDHLSRGRAVFGVGFGWNREEMAQHGVEFSTRRDKAREHVLAMHALWRDDEASFDGEYVHIEPSWSWPKPVQQPRIPTLIGGSAGPKMFGHVAEWADGWIPIGGAGIRDAMARLGEAWAAAGRSGVPEIVPFGTLPDVGKLGYYREIGCTEVVLRLPATDLDTVIRTLDDHVEVCRSADLL